jgi:hypothetical protein
VVLANSSARRRLAGGEAPSSTPTVPLSAARIDKIKGFNFQNWSIQFSCLEQELPAPCSICVPTQFEGSTRESTTSTVKKGNLDTNGSDLNKNNIIKPTHNHLLEEDLKAFEAYHKEADEIFLSCYEVREHGLIQKDAVSINIRKSEVTPEV